MVNNEEIIRDFAIAWGRRDLDAVMSFFANDAVYRGSVGPEPGETWKGKVAIRDGIAKMFEFDAGSTAHQVNLVSFGTTVFAEWSYLFAEPEKPIASGCDLFELRDGLIILKDAYRKQYRDSVSPEGPALLAEPEYRQRRYTMMPPWVIDSKRFKVHLISRELSVEPYTGSPEVINAAKDYVATLLPVMEKTGQHFDLGYVILHEGEERHWLLMQWWIAGGICCSILSEASHQSPSIFYRTDRPYMACVWESIAIEHERKAWISHALSGSRDIEAYFRSNMCPGYF